MKNRFAITRAMFLSLLLPVAALADKASPAFWNWAPTPPMGWNSYDAWGDTVTEAQVRQNAAYMKDHLLAAGWNYVVIDFRWYDADARGDDSRLNRDRINAQLSADAYGRMIPAPNRFPSSADGKGFKPLADDLHAMGLKFGFHMMRGIPRQAVKASTPIEGSQFTAADAGDPNDKCPWCPDMFGVRDNPAGQAWYDAMFRLYASWGLDFIKIDDLSFPYHKAEIEMIRHAIDKCGRPIVLSTSPGRTPVDEHDNIAQNANMWRISGDFWDRWSKLDEQFDLLGQWQGVGGRGRWPDADMIPFGRIAIRCTPGGRDHQTHFTHDEQQTLMALWALSSSPLMLGMNLPDTDAWTLDLITNSQLIAIDQDSSATRARRIRQEAGTEIWMKSLHDGSAAIGIFNRTDAPVRKTLDWSNLKQTASDVFTKRELAGSSRPEFDIPAHGVVLLHVKPQK